MGKAEVCDSPAWWRGGAGGAPGRGLGQRRVPRQCGRAPTTATKTESSPGSVAVQEGRGGVSAVKGQRMDAIARMPTGAQAPSRTATMATAPRTSRRRRPPRMFLDKDGSQVRSMRECSKMQIKVQGQRGGCAVAGSAMTTATDELRLGSLRWRGREEQGSYSSASGRCRGQCRGSMEWLE
jgi:hypothetical protein